MSKSSRNLVSTYLKPYFWILILLLLLIITNTFIAIYTPQIIRQFIDAAVSGDTTTNLVVLAAIFIGLSLVGQGITIIDTYISQRVAWKTTNRLREDLFSYCIERGPAFHQQRTPGEMIERIDGDVSFLSGFLSSLFVSIINNVLLLIGILIAFFSIHLTIGLAFFAFSLLMIVFIRKTNAVAVPFWIKNREISAKLFGFIEERLQGVEVIKHNGAVQNMLRALENLMTRKLKSERKAFMVSTLTWSSTVMLFSISTAASLALGLYFYTRGMMSIGTIFLVFTYAQMLRTPIEQLSNQFQDIQRASASIRRIQELYQYKDDHPMQEGDLHLNSDQPISIQFLDVSFCYQGDQKVLDRVSFALPAGKVLSIIGRTGSGKTTVSRLLYRFYEYDEGDIRFNGRSVREYSIQSIRQNIAIVTQEVQLLHGTLRDNITFYNEAIPDEKIKDAISRLELEEWYKKFPKGLDTHVRGEDVHLSEGEAQILSLVRILLKDPRIIILDEATSSLDPYTETLILNAIQRISEGRTVIIIAHRLQTLKFSDYIMVLENGKVKEFDTREHLQNKRESYYYTLLQQKKGDLLA